MTEWCNRLDKLCNIANASPQAAYAAYIHGEQHKYTHFLRTIADISHLLKPLDDIITNKFIPALFGDNISPNDRELFALPIKKGGMGLRIVSETADGSYNNSSKITGPLKQRIINQTNELPSPEDVCAARTETMTTWKEATNEKQSSLIERQTPIIKRNLEELSQPGASSWLGALPLSDQGFNLNKNEFQDALNLRYDKKLKNLPSTCPCNQPFTVTHAMNCHREGFINKRHDKIRNFEAQLLKKVCSDVQVEPPLQPVPSGVTFHRSANTSDDARLDFFGHSYDKCRHSMPEK